MAAEAQFAPSKDDPLRSATPAVDDVEAKRARAAIESQLFSGPPQRVKVGRYRVEGKIGAGGMGVVYRAHDPELARDVALKLLNTDAISDADASRARGRLVREARAMAQLAHPNVVHVYDVGTVEDGVFIAMELVDGDPLSDWQLREKPTWREALRRYMDAGEGLAAAHEAGIVHRDFKPENVLVGTDGRVRVGDFGLAGGPGSHTGSHTVPLTESGKAEVDKQAVSTSLTRTGALLGTPKYMAPEQEMGLNATARSDQFGYCVALYESLYGFAPFEGTTVAAYREQVAAEAVLVPPVEGDIPRWIFDVLRRGLRSAPADRHPNMRVLLDHLGEALRPAPVAAPPRRVVPWVAAIAVGVGLSIGGWALLRETDELAATPAVVATSLGGGTGGETADPRGALVTRRDVGAADGVDADGAAPRPSVDTAAAPPPPDTASGGAAIGDAGDPAVDSGDSAAAAGPAAETVTPDKATPRPRRKRGDACYYKEDKRVFIKNSKRRAPSFVAGGTCYTCRTAGAHLESLLYPPKGTTCRSNHLCVATDASACE